VTLQSTSHRLILCLVSLVGASACDKKTPIVPTPLDPPTIMCGASVTLAVDVAPTIIQYAAPVAAGGATPLTTSCTVPSGGQFPVGTTDVICSTTDAQQRRAQCVLQVTVSIAPRLIGTKILAFGDSLTEGEVSQPARMPRALEPQNSYPTVLQALLRERYITQAADIVVYNRGIGGETIGGGEDRLVDEINALKPDALLLFQGTNDVNGATLTAGAIATRLRAGINRAYRFGVKKVFVSTLLPQVPGRQKAFNPGLIEPLNKEIYYVADREGAVVVDAWAAFDPRKELLIGIDGLHPTADGYKLLAELFRDALKTHFEVPPAAAASGLFRRPSVRR